jgi:hypothetical protein
MSNEKINPVVIGNDEDGWTLFYRGTDGRKKQMRLDAETESDAVFEAANYLGVNESEVVVEYD